MDEMIDTPGIKDDEIIEQAPIGDVLNILAGVETTRLPEFVKDTLGLPDSAVIEIRHYFNYLKDIYRKNN